MIRAHVLISGFVQGVGFRWFIQEKAKELGLTGWVRNAQEGKVELVAEGEKEAVDTLIAYCNKGPFLASVTDIEVTIDKAVGEFSDFNICSIA